MQLFEAMDANDDRGITQAEYTDFLRQHKPKKGPWKSMSKIKEHFKLGQKNFINLEAFIEGFRRAEKKGLDINLFENIPTTFFEAPASGEVDQEAVNAVQTMYQEAVNSVQTMSMSEMKALIRRAGLSSGDCLEKFELRAHTIDALARGSSAAPSVHYSVPLLHLVLSLPT